MFYVGTVPLYILQYQETLRDESSPTILPYPSIQAYKVLTPNESLHTPINQSKYSRVLVWEGPIKKTPQEHQTSCMHDKMISYLARHAKGFTNIRASRHCSKVMLYPFNQAYRFWKNHFFQQRLPLMQSKKRASP